MGALAAMGHVACRNIGRVLFIYLFFKKLLVLMEDVFLAATALQNPYAGVMGQH